MHPNDDQGERKLLWDGVSHSQIIRFSAYTNVQSTSVLEASVSARLKSSPACRRNIFLASTATEEVLLALVVRKRPCAGQGQQ